MKAIVDARRRRYARRLRGRGLEIGALTNPMPLPFASEILYSDVLTPAQIDSMFPGSRHPDIISDSERFPEVAEESFDFIVANHVMEHLTDPLRALGEWHRLLRTGGFLFISLPDKRYTFDHSRPRTTISHLEEDHRSTQSPREINQCHLREWAAHVEHLEPGTEEFDRWIADQNARGFSVHNHVWLLQDVVRLMRHMATAHSIHFGLVAWSNTSFLGNEFNLLLAKRRSPSGSWRWHVAGLAALTAHPFHELAGLVRRALRPPRA